MKYPIAIVLAFCCSVSAHSQAYSIPSDGKDFWVGYMFPSYNKVAAPGTEGFYSASLLISTYADNLVQIWYFNRNTGIEVMAGQFSIPARTGKQVPIDLTSVKMSDSGDVAEYTAIHITAKRSIHVEFFSSGACSGGSFMALQTAGLGKKYVIASYGDNQGKGGLLDAGLYPPKWLETSEGFFEIVAPFDSTFVTITSNSTTMGGHPGYNNGKNHTFPSKTPYTIYLKRGQCYLVKSAGIEADDDISGSLVESTKPIAVIAGHENAMLGGLSHRSLEGRDFMVEQMLPVNTWDTTGYVMLPLRDSQPADGQTFEGVGENYRVYAFDDSVHIDLFVDGLSGSTPEITSGLPPSFPEAVGITTPVDFKGTNQKMFSVMMYDLRNFANAAPYPAPSMITVIPMSRWRTSYLWYVPANKFEVLQGYYVNVIGQTEDLTSVTGGIKCSFNGGTINPIKNVLTLVKQWKGTIPNHPELTGAQFKLNPGSYYATGPHPFIVYNFGFRALSPNFSLGDFSGDDFFFSYGAPAGMKIGGTPHLRVQIDTSCASWHICIHDSTFGFADHGIKSITLMDDPNGDQFDIHPGKVYYNTRLEDSFDPDRTNEINLNGDDTDFCFKVLINKGTDTAYAPLFIVDDQGGAVLVELYYKPPQIRLQPDSGRYLGLMLKKDSCSKFIFKNTAKSGDQRDDFKVNSANLVHNTAGFKITSISPALPVTLHGGDSIVITACYNAIDTFLRVDTILLVTGCFADPIDLQGSGAIPIIWASNHDFGSVLVDSTKCDTVGVYNIGKYPFTLTKDWLLDNYGKNFTFDTTLSGNQIPLTLNPGQKHLFTFCYTPRDEQVDSTTMHWGTTLQDPFKHSNKDVSLLLGKGVKTGFVWDRIVQNFQVDTVAIDSQIVRVYLLNNARRAPGVPPAHVDSVFIAGSNASEFKIIGNQMGFYPFANFDIKPGESIFVDIAFHPDKTTPYPIRYVLRFAQLIARGPGEKDQIINLIGGFAGVPEGVKENSQTLFTIHPNPASGNSIIISLPFAAGDKAVLTIFDLLGREVLRKDMPADLKQIEIPIGHIADGSYFAKVVSGSFSRIEKFEIRR